MKKVILLLVGFALIALSYFTIDSSPDGSIYNANQYQALKKPIFPDPNLIDEHLIEAVHTPKDFTELIQVAAQAESCKTEYWQQLELSNGLNQNILQKLDSDHPDLHTRADAILYLAHKSIISLHQIPFYFEKQLKQHWLQQQEVLEQTDENDRKILARYSELFKQFHQLFGAENKQGVDTFLQQHSTLHNQSFVVSDKHRELYFSIDDALAYLLGGVSANFRQWWLMQHPASAQTIASAIEEQASDSLIQELITYSADLNAPVYINSRAKSKGHLSSLLDYAIKSDRQTLIEPLLNAAQWQSSPLTTPSANHLLASKFTNKDELSSTTTMLNVLAEHNQFVVVIFNSRYKNWQLLGYPLKSVDKQTLASLKDANVNIIHFKQSPLPSSESLTKLEDRLQLVSLVDTYLPLREKTKELKQQCQVFEQKRDDLTPKFSSLSDWQSKISGLSNYQEKWQMLSAISPVLVDLYTIDLLKMQQEEVFEQATRLLTQWQNDQLALPQLISQANALAIHEKQFIAAKLCEIDGERGLSVALENAWIVDRFSSIFDGCKELLSDFYTLSDINKHKDNQTPSKLYRLIKDTLITEANDKIRYNSALNGFPGGRDSLALLLDHILLFKHKNPSERLALLEKILAMTELKSMHYQRLHRLQLQLPNYFEHLTRSYPHITSASNYPLSQYISIL